MAVPRAAEGEATHQRFFLIERRGVVTLLMALIVLLAFGLRVYHLDLQSMWSDEGLSLFRATLSLAEVLENTIIVDGVITRDNSPAFYFLLLHLWQRGTGLSVFALRYLGVLLSILGIPFMFLLGRQIGNRPVGLVAAFLLAISPFAVWMSQELRNYGLLITLNLASVYGLFRFLLGKREWRWLLLWAGAGLVGVYTHYFGFFVLAFGVLALLGAIVWQRRKPSLRLLLALGIPLLVLMPIVLGALDRFRAGRQVDFFFLSPLTILWQALSAFTVGISPTLDHPLWRVWPAILLAMAGMGLLLWRKRNLALALLAGYLIIPLAILIALSQINPLYNGPRHIFIGLPPFILLVSYGLVCWSGRWRVIGVVGLLFLMISQGQWLWMQYHSVELVKDDIRGAAVLLNQVAGPDDVIVLHDTLMQFTFNHYYDGAAAVIAVPLFGQQDVAQSITELNQAGESAERIWFLTRPEPRTGFPRDALTDWAEENWLRFTRIDFEDIWLRVRLDGYTSGRIDELPTTATPLDVRFDEVISLQGVALPAQMTAGETAWPVFYFTPLSAEPEDVTIQLRFVDDVGQIWAEAGGRLLFRIPRSAWAAGEMQRYVHKLDLPAGVPPGEYAVQLRVLDADLQPLPASTGGVDVALGPMQVSAGRPPTGSGVERLPDFTAQQERMGLVTLLGYNLPDSPARPGHALPLTLFWQVQRAPGVDYQLRARLLNPAGEVLSETITTPTRADYPPTAWQQDDLLQGQVSLLVPGRALDEPHQVEIAFLDPANGQPAGNPVVLKQTVPVEPWPLETTFPPIANPFANFFGGPPLIELAGYDLTQEAAQLALTLFWRSITDTIPENYRVFVHLVDENGNIVAQADGFPVQGARPPAGWRNGETIVDTHWVNLPPDLPTGNYTLYVGLYNPDTGVRLPVTSDGALQSDGRLFLQAVEHE